MTKYIGKSKVPQNCSRSGTFLSQLPESQSENLLERAGFFDDIEALTYSKLTVCQNHYDYFIKDFKRNPSCCHPKHDSQFGQQLIAKIKKAKLDPRTVTRDTSQRYLSYFEVLLPVGASLCSSHR